MSMLIFIRKVTFEGQKQTSDLKITDKLYRIFFKNQLLNKAPLVFLEYLIVECSISHYYLQAQPLTS